METNGEKLSRKGIHKYLHVSIMDTYISAVLSVGFFVLVVFKVLNRILDWDMATAYISWKDAMQLAVLWAILAFVSHSYYHKYEKKYDQ